MHGGGRMGEVQSGRVPTTGMKITVCHLIFTDQKCSMSDQRYTVKTNVRTEESDLNTTEIVMSDQMPAITHQMI